MQTTSARAVDFPEADLLEKRLDAFLEQRGIPWEAVRGEAADQGLGSPVLAVAAGSVLAGFGNHRSDLDLLVLVENENLTRFPIQSHEHGMLIDVNVRRASDVKAAAAALTTEPWPRFDSVTEDAWNHRRRALNTTSRLALGLALSATPPWDTWHAELRGDWLADVVAQWWTVEAHRLAQGARWLLGPRPRAAALRAREAVVAALNARVAAAGELYFTEKWVGQKLRLLDDTEGLALLHEVLAPPLVPGEWVPRCLDHVERLLGPAAPLHAVLRWAPGVGTMPLRDRTVVDRWQLRALETPRRDLPDPGGDGIIWSGPAGSVPEADILPLFVHDMVWLGMAHPEPEVSA